MVESAGTAMPALRPQWVRSRPKAPVPPPPPGERFAPALRAALISRSLIVVTAVMAAVTDAVLEHAWSQFGAAYVATDFIMSLVACFDALRTGWLTLGVHLLLSAVWIGVLVFVAPAVAAQLTALS